MQKIKIGADGNIKLPAELLVEHQLKPGDSLWIVPCANGWLLQVSDKVLQLNTRVQKWYAELSEEEKQAARQEAEEYLSMSDEERAKVWAEVDTGDKELDLTHDYHPARQKRR